MGLYDELDKEIEKANIKAQPVKTSGGLYDDLDREVEAANQPQPSFIDNLAEQAGNWAKGNHPYLEGGVQMVQSIPETAKVLGKSAWGSHYRTQQGINDILTSTFDTLGLKGLADRGRKANKVYEQWQNDLNINPQYNEISSVLNPKTALPTIANTVGSQADNLLMGLTGGGFGASLAKSLGLNGLAKFGTTALASSLPNLILEGSYLDKEQALEQKLGRPLTYQEKLKIKAVAGTEKAINAILESLPEATLIGRLAPNGVAKTALGKLGKVITGGLTQALGEGATETAQEGSSILAEKALGINDPTQNSHRLWNAGGLGAIGGKVIGDVTTALGQTGKINVEEQAQQVQQAQAQQIQAQKEVKAFIVGQEIANAKNNNAFDVMRKLSQTNIFSNPQPQQAVAPVSNGNVAMPQNRDINSLERVDRNNPNIVNAQEPVQNEAPIEYYPQEETNPQFESEFKPEELVKEAEPSKEAQAEHRAKFDEQYKENNYNEEKGIDNEKSENSDSRRTEENATNNIESNTRGELSSDTKNNEKSESTSIENPTYSNANEEYGRNTREHTSKTGKNARKRPSEKLAEKQLEKAPTIKAQKNIPDGTVKGSKGDVQWKLPGKKKVLFSSTKAESDTIAAFKAESNSYEELLSKLNYAPTERNIVKFYQDSGVKFEDWKLEKEDYYKKLNEKQQNKQNAQQALSGLEEQSKKTVEKEQNEVATKKQKETFSSTNNGVQNSMFNKEQFKDGQTMLFDTSDKQQMTAEEFVNSNPTVEEYKQYGFTEEQAKEKIKRAKVAPETVKKQTKKQIIDEKVRKANEDLDKNIFIPKYQKKAIKEYLNGEEREYFADQVNKIQNIIENAPKMYSTENIPLEDKKPVLHYFGGAYDCYVFEIDKNTGEMFASVSLGHEPELGFVSMEELNSVEPHFEGNYLIPAIEMDLYFDNTKTYGEIVNGDKKSYNDKVDNKEETENGHNESTVLQQSRMAEEKQGSNEELSRTSEDRPESSRSVSEIGRSDNKGLDRGRLTPEHKEIIEQEYSNQNKLNKAIEKFINEKEYEKYNELPEEIKSWLKKYTGAGGLEKQGASGKGLLDEYYTPENVVKKMWELTQQYINTDGAKVLEPSVGIGRFLEFAPKNINFDVVESMPVPAKITELLYPNANVEFGQFQKRFIDENNNSIKKVTPEYDIVIGNPPYGEYSGYYKGLGEGAKFKQKETYFINRALDLTKDNGVVAFIVPSSVLKNGMSYEIQEISKKAEILKAYRLPEKTFDTTSIGTDIVILRKTNDNIRTRNEFWGDRYFQKHPENILGEVLKGKGNWGSDIVKGDKNAVDKIEISEADKNIMETETVIEDHSISDNKPLKNSKKGKTKKSNTVEAVKAKYEEYKPDYEMSEEELQYFADTKVDGTLPKGKYRPSEKVNAYKNELYNDFNYLNGDIYEKLDQLEKEDISDKQKEIQRKKLLSVLPKPKTISEMYLTPTADFIQDFKVTRKVQKSNSDFPVDEEMSITSLYKKYASDLTKQERNGVSVSDIIDFVNGKAIRMNYSGNLDKKEQEIQRTEYVTKLKNTVDKTFNDFVITNLTAEEIEKLQDSWNRNFNTIYTPDFKKMPMLVKGLSANFYGNKLKLQDVQVEGINYLTNQGVGLLGFEVGVGKTLSGTIATVQNMQLGRCKRPLIIVPKAVKTNWIKEVHEAFPNIKINDADNLSKFDGKVEDGSITIATFQSLDNIGYSDETLEELKYETKRIRADYDKEENATDRAREKINEKNEEFIGKALAGNKKLFTFEELGFDHITVDEAHNFKNLFGNAKAQFGGNKIDNKENNSYSTITGGQSKKAKQLFLATQYILNNNNNRNVFMLTATPFNNSPLEVFNMLSYIAKDKLDKMGIYNVYQFMENYVDIDSDWVVDSKNEVTYKQVAKGFKNLQSLQGIIDSCMLIRSAEDAGIERPNKITKHFALNPTGRQKEIIAKTEALAVGMEIQSDGSIRLLDKEERKGIQLKAISDGRIATLSPDIYEKNYDVSPEDFVKDSPKIDFIMQAVEKMKKRDPKTSQLIYMPIGVDFLPKMKEYLVNKGIYKENEIAIIRSGVKEDKIDEYTTSFNDINGKVKLIIGTDKIKEGMNLNKNSSVLYIPFIDWNPTDYVQAVGRIWRRGNRYKDIRIIVPTLNDSSDSFMYQKLDEKTSRINNIMDRGKDYIDTGELNVAEEKINMITDPEKKARMFSQIESQKLDSKENEIKGRIEDTKYYLREIESSKNEIKRYEDSIERATKELSEIQDKENWQYSSKKGYIETYKKNLKSAKAHLEALNKKIKRLELDFNGKDSVENLTKELEDIKKQKENLKETTAKKLEEYKIEYEKNKITGKKIEDYVKEFDDDTVNLYSKDKKLNQAVQETEINNIASGSRAKEVQELVKPVFEKLSNVMGVPVDTLIKEETPAINTYNYANDKIKGSYNPESNIIDFFKNADKSTSVHEVGHFILNTWEKYSSKNNEIKSDVEAIRKFVGNKGEDFTAEQNEKFARAFEAYIRDGKAATNKLQNVFSKFKRALRAIYRSIKDIFYKQGDKIKYFTNKDMNNIDDLFNRIFTTKNERYNSELTKANQKAKNYIHNWYANIEADRYDTNKALNSLIRTSDNIGKEFSKKYKQKINGKMIREIMPFLRERTEFPQSLNRPELRKLFYSLSPEDKTRLTKLADDSSAKIEKYYNTYKELKGTVTEQDIENHISHIWETDKKQKSMLTNYFATNSRFAKQRTIESFIKGIDGIETENGEVIKLTPKTLDYAELLKTSSDTFIKANADMVLANAIKNFKHNGELLVKRADKAPSDWVDFNHPALNKALWLGELVDGGSAFTNRPVKVHPAIADTLKTVFEDPTTSSDFITAYDKLNSVYKQAQLGFSGFHMVALSESMLGNMGIKETLKILNPVRMFKEISKGNYGIYKDDTLGHQAIKDGLQFGSTLDLDRKTVEKIADDVENWISKRVPVVGKVLAKPFHLIGAAQRLNNKILWDYLHNNYKLECYKLLCLQESKKGTLTDNQRKEIAQWVNDSFGGQVWENLGIKPSSRKVEQRILLSPDWLRSTTRQFMAMFSNGKLAQNMSKEETNNFWKRAKEVGSRWGIDSLTGDVESSQMRGKIARAFWIRSLVYSTILYNVLNAVMRGWDKKKHPEYYEEPMTAKDYSIYANSNPTDSVMDKLLPRVFVGRNADGTERMLRLGKQFREVPEMLEDPIKKLGGKVSPMGQLIAQSATGHTAGGYKNRDMFEKDGKTLKNRAVAIPQLAAKSLMPYSLNSLTNPYAEPTAWSLFAPVSKGMTKGKAKRAYEAAYKRNDSESVIPQIDKIAKRNGLDEKDIRKQKRSAMTSNLKPYKEAYVEALKNNDQKAINKVYYDMQKKHIDPDEMQRVYEKALKEFEKSLGY